MGYKLHPETFKRALSVHPSVDFVRSVVMRMKMMMETERGKGQSAQSTKKSYRFEKITLYVISNSSTVTLVVISGKISRREGGILRQCVSCQTNGSIDDKQPYIGALFEHVESSCDY